VYDNELLELIAGNMRVRTSLLESVDERRKNWLEERVEAFAAVPHVSSNAYVRHLVETILSLGEHGECIIVGRGAPVLLPARSTLRVRLVAAWDDRVNVICRELGLSRADAARKVKAMDRERFAFVKEYFHRDPTDPLNYDLVLNTSRLSYDDSADVIVAAAQRLQARMARSVPRSEVLERELAAVPR
jgi:cytidylate kinase